MTRRPTRGRSAGSNNRRSAGRHEPGNSSDVPTGRVVELSIERLSYSADCIAHLPDGKTAFVAGGCPGDVVKARIIAEKKDFARASIEEVVSPSPFRVEAACPYASVCGGCPWQHIGYGAQIAAKRENVIGSLVHIGKFSREEAEALCSSTLPSFSQWHGRNKVEFSVEGPRLELGLHAQSGGFVAIEKCMLLPLRAEKAPKAIAGALRYLQGSQQRDLGVFRVGVRAATGTPDAEIALWTDPGAFPRKAVAEVLSSAVSQAGIVRVLAKEHGSKRTVAGVEVLSGKGFWKEKLGGREYRISAPSFFQTNTAGANALQKLVMDFLAPSGGEKAFDLYCGAGTFTLPLAQACRQVVAVESEGSSIGDLRRNLEAARLSDNVEVRGGDVARELPLMGQADLVVVDPPKAGLAPDVADAICEAAPSRLAYVSCDPATLARDLAILCKDVFKLERLAPVDLFPQTYHNETVAMLSLR